ncbi:ATP-binding cassette domain-containing protein [Tessaracoccus sp. MC1865]|uniref:ABC transporter ATP-binding protein n=1 Tax=Tessaracoccus sp. MC1865 TaxID=2760310 RepID=UPI001603928F|nr:ABC transporter ATP-binding protein [Tessaracoccus sp. MC1865]MBB1484320.1 ATP-binding cassette domain-containing protein [Tessaracoccus sp. MC1865]QTO38563.1 ATP-binding cassette domain-containing protein [Tessaracoccus sp. MC1865]
MIRFENISFHYASSETLRLDAVGFRIDEGELCLVVGPTGTGKSTLLGCINNLVPRFTGGIRTGRVFIDGVDTTLLQPRELATTVGYVGQDPLAGFVTDTVEEELAYSMEQLGFAPPEMRRRVEETLDLLGIAELRDRNLRTLSGGQQQRVAIGSVLASSPKVLVLDEPTSALDPIAAEEVLAIISRLVRDLGTTVVIAEHRMERVIEFADSVLLVGDEVHHGDTRDILAKASIKPPLVELGTRMSWSPLPLTIREGRRFAAEHRRAWAEVPPALPTPTPRTEPELTARDIIVRYGSKVAVAGVDLTLHAGEVTALMGRNGCGKSSLLWALHGAGRRDGGSVTMPAPGQVSEVPGIALVPQTPSDLLYLTSVAAECEQSDRSAGLPTGSTLALLRRLVPDIEPDAHPRDLSEGQKLAVVLAVELAGNPRVVLLDEPTRGLDYAAKQALTEIVAGMAADGRAVLIATHDVEMVAQTCERVVVMAEGEVVSDGPTRDVLAGSALLATQVAKVVNPVPLLTVEEFLDAAR